MPVGPPPPQLLLPVTLPVGPLRVPEPTSCEIPERNALNESEYYTHTLRYIKNIARYRCERKRKTGFHQLKATALKLTPNIPEFTNYIKPLNEEKAKGWRKG
ncbi:hypothetical protein RUM43_014020 [Polyplax serrata]|uniref:Uncharacterized protein n=1 Tax=Polyplax serrata TaxID=468196 RepID=A0AAN8RS85_POLSC